MRTKVLFAVIAFAALLLIAGCAKDRVFEPVQLPDLPELVLVDPAAEHEKAVEFARTMFNTAMAAEDAARPALMALMLRFIEDNNVDPRLITPNLTIEMIKALANPPRPLPPPSPFSLI